jgi:hypothetical protein
MLRERNLKRDAPDVSYSYEDTFFEPQGPEMPSTVSIELPMPKWAEVCMPRALSFVQILFGSKIFLGSHTATMIEDLQASPIAYFCIREIPAETLSSYISMHRINKVFIKDNL